MLAIILPVVAIILIIIVYFIFSSKKIDMNLITHPENFNVETVSNPIISGGKRKLNKNKLKITKKLKKSKKTSKKSKKSKKTSKKSKK